MKNESNGTFKIFSSSFCFPTSIFELLVMQEKSTGTDETLKQQGTPSQGICKTLVQKNKTSLSNPLKKTIFKESNKKTERCFNGIEIQYR